MPRNWIGFPAGHGSRRNRTEEESWPREPTRELEQHVHRIFALIDAMDTDAMSAMLTEDPQWID
jgi:hypothetical protein